jgi:hypothetical protein
MTFEEFFAKKKIDLTALQKADNSLYEEFKKHYMAMGSKSFDHTKKFWFNKLRKSYHLAETPIDKKEVQQAIVKEQQSVKAEATTTATGFKPRFKAPAPKKDVLSQESETPINRVEKISEYAPDNDGPAKPTGFKPRFKAPTVTQDIVPQETETSNNRVDKISDSASDNDVAAKPTGFKPRFKAGVTKPAAEQNTIPSDPQAEGQADHLGASHPATEATSADLPTEASSKPAGFKPRFKAGITKQATAAQDNIPTDQQAQEQTDHLGASHPATEATSADLPTEASSKPAGFKPRFKAGITKQATAVQDNIPTEQQAQEQTDNTVASHPATEATSADLPTEASSKPAGFKPRFKAGITKQATAAQHNIPTEQQAQELTDHLGASDPATETISTDLQTEASSKPAGFKPRFKAGITKQATAALDNISTEQAEGQTDKTAASIPTTETTLTDLPTEAGSKPAGFKPRFKAGITKQATEVQDNIPTEQQVEGQTDKTVASIPTTETAPVDLPTQESSKPAGFKPRFKAGVTKLKNKDTD